MSLQKGTSTDQIGGCAFISDSLLIHLYITIELRGKQWVPSRVMRKLVCRPPVDEVSLQWVPSRVMRKLVCRPPVDEVSLQWRRLPEPSPDASYSYISCCPIVYRQHAAAWRRPASVQSCHPGKSQPRGYGVGSPGSAAQ